MIELCCVFFGLMFICGCDLCNSSYLCYCGRLKMLLIDVDLLDAV